MGQEIALKVPQSQLNLSACGSQSHTEQGIDITVNASPTSQHRFNPCGSY